MQCTGDVLKHCIWHHCEIETRDCSQPYIFLYFYFIIERAGRIARELDASAIWETLQSREWGSGCEQSNKTLDKGISFPPP